MIDKTILTVILLVGSGMLHAQSPRFEDEQFSYYWAMDKLVSLRTPMMAFGVEYKLPYRLSVAFEAGYSGRRHLKSGTLIEEIGREISKSFVLKTGIHLKYFFKKQYSDGELRRWRKRVAIGKKAFLQNRPGKKYYFGVNFTFKPESYLVKNGFYYAYNPTLGFRSTFAFSSATVKSNRYRIGISYGRQKKFKSLKGYVETGVSLGLQMRDVEYFKVVPTIGAATGGFYFYEPLDAYRGKLILPFLHFSFIVGFY